MTTDEPAQNSEIFPLDDVTLSILRESLNSSLSIDDDGNPYVEGGGFTVSKFLEFLSNQEEGLELDGVVEMLGTGWSLNDVCRALVDEIFRLRAELGVTHGFGS